MKLVVVVLALLAANSVSASPLIGGVVQVVKGVGKCVGDVLPAVNGCVKVVTQLTNELGKDVVKLIEELTEKLDYSLTAITQLDLGCITPGSFFVLFCTILDLIEEVVEVVGRFLLNATKHIYEALYALAAAVANLINKAVEALECLLSMLPLGCFKSLVKVLGPLALLGKIVIDLTAGGVKALHYLLKSVFSEFGHALESINCFCLELKGK